MQGTVLGYEQALRMTQVVIVFKFLGVMRNTQINMKQGKEKKEISGMQGRK